MQASVWESSIEVHFCFHSIPVHIGLLSDSKIDMLSFKKDHVLVNDDDHEDLLRVCDLYHLYKKSSVQPNNQMSLSGVLSYERAHRNLH
mmetsp:Transcript_20961/g.32499  ORF Transcript_20961/g.32499 Transcript_20961/m.32499 type:complete len:89 (+) Transcript_20961:362-628(+)